jgi:ribonuclease J
MKKNVTKFTLYSGLRTIGGVIASVSYGNNRVIFEFGSAFDPATSVFDGIVDRRPNHWIGDMLKAGILPRIDGIYRREDLDGFPLDSAEDTSWNTAVFITHLHLDHMALMGAVAPQVPVYLHRNAQTIERALEATGEGIPTLEREYTDFEPDVPIRAGELEVLPILCRDTGYCDFAFLVTTPDGTIHWTGDLCQHSVQAERTDAQMELLKAKNIDIMLCDATSFMDSFMEMIYGFTDVSLVRPDPDVPANMLSERQHREAMRRIICGCRGLCVFNYYTREMDDADFFLCCGKDTGRICAFEPEAAYVVYKFFAIRPHVYIPDSGRYAAGAEPGWLRELMEHCVVVTRKQIAKNPGAYLLQNSYRHIMELFGLPGREGVYLHAGGYPVGDFDPAYQNMRRILEKAGFKLAAAQDNYLGHSYPGQVKYFVDAVDPDILIPCHSCHPERLLPLHGRQLLPALNQTYILEEHRFYPCGNGDEHE